MSMQKVSDKMLADTGTMPAWDGSALTSLSADNMTAGGAFPAIDGSALTNLPTSSINIGALAVMSTNQDVSHNTWTKVVLNEETYDIGGDFDHATNYRFTVPTGGAGKYLITGEVQYTATDAKTYECAIYVNGSSEYFTSTLPGRSNYAQSTGVTVVLELTDTDYVEMYTRQNSGSTVEMLGPSSTNDRTWLNVIKLD